MHRCDSDELCQQFVLCFFYELSKYGHKANRVMIFNLFN